MVEGTQQTPYLKGDQNQDSQSCSSLQKPDFIATQHLLGPSMTTVNPGALAPQTTAAMSVEWLEQIRAHILLLQKNVTEDRSHLGSLKAILEDKAEIQLSSEEEKRGIHFED